MLHFVSVMSQRQQCYERIEQFLTGRFSFVRFINGGSAQHDPWVNGIKIELPHLLELEGWLLDALPFTDHGFIHSRVQSVALGIVVERDLWGRPVHVYRNKGLLEITVGPFFLQFGG